MIEFPRAVVGVGSGRDGTAAGYRRPVPPLDRLFEPLVLGPRTARNRVVLGAHHTLFNEPSPVFGEPGLAGARLARYLGERAEGGVGTVVVGQITVHPRSAYQVANMAIGWDRAAIDGLAVVADAVHRHGALVIAQLTHNGAMVPAHWSRQVAHGPNAMAHHHEPPVAMTTADIDDAVMRWGRAARHAAAAGFDGVEIHAAHGYLLHQFLSPRWNDRDDDFGGSAENRLRLVRQVVAQVRQSTPNDFVVGVRMPSDDEDRAGRGLTVDDCAAIAVALAPEVDYLNVSVGRGGLSSVRPMFSRPGYAVERTGRIRRAVRDAGLATPVLAGHRITRPAEAEAVIANGDADGVLAVRALIADPEWVAKAAAGNADRIRLCTGCNQSCYGNLTLGAPMACATNPAVGREDTLGRGTILRTRAPRKVVVVGGGPAGLEAAWVAAARGHDVDLFEAAPQLGGRILAAAQLPGRAEVAEFVRWRIGECERRGVKVHLGRAVSADDVVALGPDAVIVATGGRPDPVAEVEWHPPVIPTADVATTVLDHYTAIDRAIADGPGALGRRVVVVDMVGFVEAGGLAELLATGGTETTWTMPFAEPIACDPETRMALLRRAGRAGVDVRAFSVVFAVDTQGVHVAQVMSGQLDTISDVDTVVVRAHGRGDSRLATALADLRPELEVHVIGDAVAMRLVDKAINDGNRLGRQL